MILKVGVNLLYEIIVQLKFESSQCNRFISPINAKILTN
jgi:hypothetical protein